VIATLACVSVVVNVALAFACLSLWGVVGVCARKFCRLYRDHVAVPCTLRSERWVIFSVRGARGFIARTILANLAAYGAALAWGGIFGRSSPLAIVVGQFVIVAVANFLVARTAPLQLTVRAIFRG